MTLIKCFSAEKTYKYIDFFNIKLVFVVKTNKVYKNLILLSTKN